ncbi:PIN domain-containing protein [Pelagophyceae sp. CCMP2097]|nr:PIN domain-containing protein [Pelagophyceae sp. CCMP2097]
MGPPLEADALRVQRLCRSVMGPPSDSEALRLQRLFFAAEFFRRGFLTREARETIESENAAPASRTASDDADADAAPRYAPRGAPRDAFSTARPVVDDDDDSDNDAVTLSYDDRPAAWPAATGAARPAATGAAVADPLAAAADPLAAALGRLGLAPEGFAARTFAVGCAVKLSDGGIEHVGVVSEVYGDGTYAVVAVVRGAKRVFDRRPAAALAALEGDLAARLELLSRGAKAGSKAGAAEAGAAPKPAESAPWVPVESLSGGVKFKLNAPKQTAPLKDAFRRPAEPAQSQSSSLAPPKRPVLRIVLDTNVFLNEDRGGQSLKNYLVGGCDVSGTIFVVPRQVLFELDGLKRGDGDVAKAARFANHFLRQTTEPWLSLEALESRAAGSTADEAILECALRLQRTVRENDQTARDIVLLCTDDVNLGVLAKAASLEAAPLHQCRAQAQARDRTWREAYAHFLPGRNDRAERNAYLRNY